MFQFLDVLPSHSPGVTVVLGGVGGRWLTCDYCSSSLIGFVGRG